MGDRVKSSNDDFSAHPLDNPGVAKGTIDRGSNMMLKSTLTQYSRPLMQKMPMPDLKPMAKMTATQGPPTPAETQGPPTPAETQGPPTPAKADDNPLVDT